MVDTETEPVSVTVDGGEIVDVEVNRNRPRLPLPDGGAPDEHIGGSGGGSGDRRRRRGRHGSEFRCFIIFLSLIVSTDEDFGGEFG